MTNVPSALCGLTRKTLDSNRKYKGLYIYTFAKVFLIRH